MAEFANYYLEFLWQLGENIGRFFSAIFSAISNIFTRDIPDYFFNLGQAVEGFDVLGWITLFLVSIINMALVALILYRIFLAARKYFFIRHKDIEKEELLEEITKLKEQTEQLALEKNKIFSLKLNELNAFSGEIGQIDQGDLDEKIEEGRFSKLISIDRKYLNNPFFVNMSDEDMLSLPKLVKNFTYFAASQMKLYYNQSQIRQFFAGMATSKVIIIEGISGTGKTSLPYAVSKFFFNNALMVSVQPSWRERSDLLGYLNEFTKKFNETDFLKGLYEATYKDDINFIVLDEMNLARIEYYFADFLSIMEMPDTSEWKIDLVPNPEDTDPKNLIDGKLTVPQNLWFVGTANQDDSTFTITDKVYDRAITLQMNQKGSYFDAPVTNPVNLSFDYLESLFDKALSEYAVSQDSLNKIEKLDEFLRNKLKISFGNRILKQIRTFVPVYMGCGGTEYEALDFMFLTKILKKLVSLNLVFLIKELGELIALMERLFGKGKLPQSIEYIRNLQKSV